MRYQEYPVAPALRRYVQRICSVEGEPIDPPRLTQRIVAETDTELVYHLGAPFEASAGKGPRIVHPDFAVVGPRSEPIFASTTGATVTIDVRLRSSAVLPLLRHSPKEFVNRVIPAQLVLPMGREYEEVHARRGLGPDEIVPAVQKHLLRLVERAGHPDRRVEVAATALASDSWGLLALAGDLRITPRRLQQIFLDATGLPAVHFRAIRRFRRALRMLLIEGTSLVELAFSAGYSDQAQLSREFLRFAGVPPTTYRREKIVSKDYLLAHESLDESHPGKD